MKINLKKYLSNFERNGYTIARIIDSNLPKADLNKLHFYEGVHTIRNIMTEDEKLYAASSTAKFEQIGHDKIIAGYLESENATAIHFLSKNKKIFKTMTASYYHSIADDLAEIVLVLKTYPKIELVLDVSNITDNLGGPSFDFVRFFLEKLEDLGVTYHLVDFGKYDIIYADNFAVLNFPFHSGARLDILSDFMFQFVSDKSIAPTKKFFVSRKMNGLVADNPSAVNFSYQNDNRIDNHIELEKIFIELGFEVIDPESIKSFQDQIDLFYSAKTIVSLTSSGLTNGIFMQPGGTIVEIMTPLITKSPLIHADYFKKNDLDPTTSELDLHLVQELHMFYHNLAFFKNHTYVGIPNFSRSHNDVRNFIDASPKLKRFLSE